MRSHLLFNQNSIGSYYYYLPALERDHSHLNYPIIVALRFLALDCILEAFTLFLM